MKPRLGAACLLASGLLAAGCAGTALRPDTSELEQEVQRLRAQVVELQRQAAMNEVEMARLRQQLGEGEARRTGAAPARPANPPPPRTTGTQASAPVPRTSAPPPRVAPPPPAAAPRRETPVPVKPQPAAPTTPDSIQEDPPMKAEEVGKIEEADIDLPPSPDQLPDQPPVPPATPSEEVLPPTSQALYDRGYTLYHQAHFVDAETSFQRFLQGNPKSELADNAQYWIGECRYARGDMRGALAAFRETVTRFPEGNKVPDAMLKAGQCLEALDDVEGARTTYREVTRRFPGTAAATVAEERRAKLR